MEPIQNTSLFQSNIDANSSYVLRGAATWAKVVGIVTILMGLGFFLMAFAVYSNPSDFERGFRESYRRDDATGNASLTIGVVTFSICGVVMLIASAFAIGFGNKITRGVRSNDNASLASGFASLRNYFAFWGIILIIMLLFFTLSIAGLIIAASR